MCLNIYFVIMGIFALLKSCDDPRIIRQLNCYLKFVVRLAETSTKIQFLSDCITTNEYPVFYWRFLRRAHIQPNSKTLKRHALNEIDSARLKITELKQLVSKYRVAVDELISERRILFEKFVNEVVMKRSEARRDKLISGIKKRTPQPKFSTNPEKFVFNYSAVTLNQLQLEALSLGPKFCASTRKVNRINVESQFEHLFNQLNDLQPISKDASDALKSQFVKSMVQRFNGG